MKNAIVYRYTFRKKGYKPFTKTISKPIDNSIVLGDCISLSHINRIIKETGEGFMQNNDNSVIESLNINVTAYYDNEKIKIKSVTYNRNSLF